MPHIKDISMRIRLFSSGAVPELETKHFMTPIRSKSLKGQSQLKREVTKRSDIAMEPSQPQAVKLFEGSVIIPNSAWKKSTFGRDEANFNRQKLGIVVLWGLGALALAVVLFVLRFRKEWVTENSFVARYHQVKIDMKVALLFYFNLCCTDFIGRSWSVDIPGIFCINSIENGIILGIAVCRFGTSSYGRRCSRWSTRGTFKSRRDVGTGN